MELQNIPPNIHNSFNITERRPLEKKQFKLFRNKTKLRFLYGRWTEFLCSADPTMLASMLNCKPEKMDPSASNLPKVRPV